MADTVISGYLECPMCLEMFDNPKRLTCGHLFCKTCLEDIIEFAQDGSAEIPCPMRCTIQTFIEVNQTLDDLAPVSYQMKGILDALKSENEALNPLRPLCSYVKECVNDVSFYCCGYTMCKSCSNEHVKVTGGIHKISNCFFDQRDRQLHLLCDKHSSKCIHSCDDQTFFCKYCINRFRDEHSCYKHDEINGHKGSKYNDNNIEHEAALIRETLIKDSLDMEKIRRLLDATEENISATRKKLDDLLLKRKSVLLSSYIDLLDKEEEAIRKTFRNVCEDHITQYPDVIPADYYERKLLLDDMMLVIEKSDIMNHIEQRKLFNLRITDVTVSLTDCLDQHDGRLLGELKVIVGESMPLIPISDLNSLSSTFKDSIRPCRLGSSSQTLFNEVKRLIENSSSPTKMPSKIKRAAPSPPVTAKVVFEYYAEQEGELTLALGDIVNNVIKVDDGWMRGELNGKIGEFPMNFVALV